MAYNRDPKTKSEIIDRLLRRDFDGDLTKLGQDGQTMLERKGANVLALKFQNSGEVYELTVHKRRDQQKRQRAPLSRRNVEARIAQVAGQEGQPSGEAAVQRSPTPARRGRTRPSQTAAH